MIDIKKWVEEYLIRAKDLFGERLVFVGLQGSYGRGEATENSDIDVVLILDEVKPGDLSEYGKMLDTLAHRSKVCGFVSGLAYKLRLFGVNFRRASEAGYSAHVVRCGS